MSAHSATTERAVGACFVEVARPSGRDFSPPPPPMMSTPVSAPAATSSPTPRAVSTFDRFDHAQHQQAGALHGDCSGVDGHASVGELVQAVPEPFGVEVGAEVFVAKKGEVAQRVHVVVPIAAAVVFQKCEF